MEHVGAPCASLTQAMKTGSSRLLATTYVASYGEGPTFIPYTSEAHGTQRRPALAVLERAEELCWVFFFAWPTARSRPI